MIILNFLTDANGNPDYLAIIMALAVFAIALFALREINLWYWRINDSIKNQEEQIRLLKKIAGEKEELDSKSKKLVEKLGQ